MSPGILILGIRGGMHIHNFIKIQKKNYYLLQRPLVPVCLFHLVPDLLLEAVRNPIILKVNKIGFRLGLIYATLIQNLMTLMIRMTLHQLNNFIYRILEYTSLSPYFMVED